MNKPEVFPEEMDHRTLLKGLIRSIIDSGIEITFDKKPLYLSGVEWDAIQQIYKDALNQYE